MPRPRKFRKGRKVEDIYDLIHSARVGCWFWWGDKPKHPSFILAQQINTAINLVHVLHIAERINPTGDQHERTD